jgi:hypothetical protein
VFGPITVSPSGDRLCVVGKNGSQLEGFVLGPNEELWRVELGSHEPFWTGMRCAFASEDRVMLGSQLFSIDDAGLSALGDPITNFTLWGSLEGALYGVASDQVVRVDVAAGGEPGEPEVLIDAGELSLLCERSGSTSTEMIFAPDARPLAIVKRSCGCIDCDISGSMALDLRTGEHTLIERSFGEHELYKVAWPPPGGALLFSTQFNSPDDPQPPHGSIYSIDTSANVSVEAVLPSAEGGLHGPAVPMRR